MINEPVLLIPSFRSGRETPWAGDVLRRNFEKYTLGNKIGESYDFSLLPDLESSTPDGERLSEVLSRAGLLPMHIPFLIKWVDASDAMSVHVHPFDEYLVAVRTEKNALLTDGFADGVTKEYLEKILLSESPESAFLTRTIRPGDVIHIPAGTPHALRGVTCYQIQPQSGESFRLFDWNRTNARGQKRAIQYEKAISAAACGRASISAPDSGVLIRTPAYSVRRIAADTQQLTIDGRFAVLTCIQPAHIILSSDRHLYLSAGQSVFIPNAAIPCTITTNDCLLAVSDV